MRKLYRYNKINLEIIGKKILEFGPCEESLLKSKLKEKILSSSYLGVDIVDRKNEHLHIIQGDLITYPIEETYDTILALDILEHIHFREWVAIFQKLRDALLPNGFLIVTVPRKQQLSKYIRTIPMDYYQIHTIFGITPKVMDYFLPGCTVKTIRNIVWKDKNESHLWALLRFVKRIIKRDFNPFKSNYLIVWRK